MHKSTKLFSHNKILKMQIAKSANSALKCKIENAILKHVSTLLKPQHLRRRHVRDDERRQPQHQNRNQHNKHIQQ